jgi:hypothetical protein
VPWSGRAEESLGTAAETANATAATVATVAMKRRVDLVERKLFVGDALVCMISPSLMMDSASAPAT